MITLTILGNNSALPAYDRSPTAQLVEIRDQMFMIDCGEGTQMQMQKHQIGWKKINHIFISHLHGDHYFGLVGFLTTMNLLGRTTELHLYGPPELKSILFHQIRVGGGNLAYPFKFHPIKNTGEAKVLFEDKHCKVSCFPVIHRIACHGFVVTSKSTGRKIIPEECQAYGIPNYYYAKLKEGLDYQNKAGEIIKNEWVTEDANPEISYAYCADTLYTDSFHHYIQNCNAIYHESTYLKEHTDKAIERFHSTAEQAALTAQQVNTKLLLLGHYSSRYEDVAVFEAEAKTIFENSIATKSGDVFIFKNEKVAKP